MTCLVCGSRQSEPHFGGNSCRACAAFFRRYFNSNKSVIVCICKTKKVNSHPCRSCRMAKCFAIGMTPLKIHGQRDPNGSSPRKLEKSISPLDLKFPTYTTHISPRHTSNISLSLPNFVEYEKKRWEIFQRPESIGLYKATSFTKQDFDITWEFVSESFPEFQKLLASDKKAMLNNFLIKIWNIEPVMDHVAERVKYEKMNEEEMMTVAFPMYDGSFLEGEEMGKDEIWRTFGVHWNRYFSLLIDPLITLALDKMEMMAVIWILFFDYAYINISQNCSDFSWNMRKVILQELKNYELEKNFTEEQAQSRFLEILEIPLIVERGEKQFHEEMILCELYKLRMHDDFRVMMKKQRI